MIAPLQCSVSQLQKTPLACIGGRVTKTFEDGGRVRLESEAIA